MVTATHPPHPHILPLRTCLRHVVVVELVVAEGHVHVEGEILAIVK